MIGMPHTKRPLPKPQNFNATYFKAAAQGKFLLQRCATCQHIIFYPRVACPYCLATEGLTWEEVDGRGTVYTFSLVHRPQHPAFLEDIPIPLAVIQLEEGPLIISTVINCSPEKLHIGMRVKVRPEPIAADIGLPKFEPLAPEQF